MLFAGVVGWPAGLRSTSWSTCRELLLITTEFAQDGERYVPLRHVGDVWADRSLFDAEPRPWERYACEHHSFSEN